MYLKIIDKIKPLGVVNVLTTEVRNNDFFKN